MLCLSSAVGGLVTSEVVGSGWTHVTLMRTVGAVNPGLASPTLCLLEAAVLRESCSLSFSRLVPPSPDDDLPGGGFLLGFGAFTPLLEPVARERERTSKPLRTRTFLEFVETRRKIVSD